MYKLFKKYYYLFEPRSLIFMVTINYHAFKLNHLSSQVDQKCRFLDVWNYSTDKKYTQLNT